MARLIGTLACRGLDCGEKVAVNETAGASLSMKCGFCGFSTYAPPGTKSARRIKATMKADDDITPDAPPAGDDDPAPAPAKVQPKPAKTAKTNSVFHLGL